MYSEFSKEPVCIDEVEQIILIENTFVGVLPNGMLIYLAKKYVPKIEVIQTAAPNGQEAPKKTRGRPKANSVAQAPVQPAQPNVIQ